MTSTAVHNILLTPDSNGMMSNLLSLLGRAGVLVRAHEFDGQHVPDDIPGSQCYDLILLDCDSAGADCEALLRQLQHTRRDIPCLLICRSPSRWLPMLSLGAAALVSEPALESAAGQVQFVYLVKRELEQLRQRRESRRAAGTVRELHQRLQLFMDNTSDAIACLQDGLHQYANPAWLRFFGLRTAADLHTIAFLDLVAEEDVERVRNFLRGPFEPGQQRCEFTAVRRDGTEILAFLDSAVVSINGEQSLQLIVREAHGNAARTNDIREAASRDLQSGLLNEEHLLRAINLSISTAIYQGRHSALIMLSSAQLAEFAVILGKTDTLLLVRDIAGLLQSHCPPGAVLGRLDAGDFVVLSADADTESCQALLQRLENIQTGIMPMIPRGLSMQFQLGAAMITEEAPDAETLLLRARQHQNLRSHQLRQRQGSSASNAVLEQVRQALHEERVILVYQPTVSLRADSREYFEVRIRIPAPDRLIYPDEFLEAANQLGIGERIDRYVIRQALRAIDEQNNERLRLTINLTANSLMSRTMLLWLTQELQRQQQTPRQLIIQVSELDFLSAPEQASQFCQQLRDLGFEVSLSHFGCSLDPFRMLGQLQMDFVKLDRALLQNIALDGRQRERLDEVVSALHAQGVRVIAPLVEDVELLPLLWQANINFVQGNCLQQPVDHLNFSFFTEQEIRHMPA